MNDEIFEEKVVYTSVSYLYFLYFEGIVFSGRISRRTCRFRAVTTEFRNRFILKML